MRSSAGAAPEETKSKTPSFNSPQAGVAAGWWTRPARVAVLILSDVFAFAVVGTAAYLLWALPVRNMEAGMYLELWPFLALFILGFAQAGLYPGFGLGPIEIFRRFSLVTFVSFTILAAVTFAFKLPHQYSRMTFGIAFLLSVVALPAFRFLTLTVSRRWAWWRQPVVLVGEGSSILRTISTLQESPLLGYRPHVILSRQAPEGPSEIAGLPVLGLEMAADMAGRGVSVALIDPKNFEGRSEFDALQQHFRHLLVIQSYGSLPVEGVQIRNLGGVLVIEFSNNLLERRNRWVKRLLDLGLGSLLLAIFGPVILVCALWVRARSRGPAFFHQERVGLRGRRFLVPKIRTMQPNAHEELEAHLASDATMRDEWERGFKLRSDPRIIPIVGVFLRRWSLDELPQFWSVLRGDMSLVGPRPFPDYHLEQFSTGARAFRQLVRPGITGLWQVTLRGDGDVEAQQRSDHYYIRNWSVWLDLYILAKTFSAVLSGRGAY